MDKQTLVTFLFWLLGFILIAVSIKRLNNLDAYWEHYVNVINVWGLIPIQCNELMNEKRL